MMSCTWIGALTCLAAVTISSDAHAWCNPADTTRSVSAGNHDGLPPNIETAEGMSYHAVAMLHPRQVWVSEGGRFETARAIGAGLQVKRDVAVAVLNTSR
jgi:hypothetical protein